MSTVPCLLYTSDLHTEPAEVACTTNGVSVSGNEITISEDSALTRIDQGLSLIHIFKLKKTVGAPTIQTSMTAPSYVEKLENTTVLYDDLFIPLLAKMCKRDSSWEH